MWLVQEVILQLRRGIQEFLTGKVRNQNCFLSFQTVCILSCNLHVIFYYGELMHTDMNMTDLVFLKWILYRINFSFISGVLFIDKLQLILLVLSNYSFVHHFGHLSTSLSVHL